MINYSKCRVSFVYSLKEINIIAMKNTIILSFLLLFGTSCVPLKQFSDIKSRAEKVEDANLLLKEQNRELTVERNELEGKLNQLQRKFKELEEREDRLTAGNRQLQSTNDKLAGDLKDLEEQIAVLKEGSSEEITQLLKELQVLQEDLQEREDRIKLASEELEAQKNDLAQTRSDLSAKEKALNDAEQILADQQARLQELQAALDAQKEAVGSLKDKLNQALRGFYNQGLSVYEKNGKVYVSLEEQLLFKTGSYTLGANGQEAIKSLAGVLAANPDINIMVEGHTDDVPLNGSGQIKDNWDLSTMRATAVTKIILNNTQIDPSRITAAGRGEYVPLETGQTPEARKKNRRTEIILTPDLKEVFKILE